MLKIELHDIHQDNFKEIDQMLKLLDQYSIADLSLMVIPEIDSPKDSNSSKEEFRKWLLEKEEIVYYNIYCHGWKHIADPKLKRSLMGKKICKITNNEAEFAGLSKYQIRKLLKNALAAWDDLSQGKIECCGFVAPTWHAPRIIIKQALDLGFKTVGTRFLWWWENEKGSLQKEWSIPLSMFSNDTKKLEQSLAWARKANSFFHENRVRLLLHPVDFDSPQKAALMKTFLDDLFRIIK